MHHIVNILSNAFEEHIIAEARKGFPYRVKI